MGLQRALHTEGDSVGEHQSSAYGRHNAVDGILIPQDVPKGRSRGHDAVTNPNGKQYRATSIPRESHKRVKYQRISLSLSLSACCATRKTVPLNTSGFRPRLPPFEP